MLTCLRIGDVMRLACVINKHFVSGLVFKMHRQAPPVQVFAQKGFELARTVPLGVFGNAILQSSSWGAGGPRISSESFSSDSNSTSW